MADSFLSFINNPEFLKRVEVNYSENMTWSALHFAIAKQFLGKLGLFNSPTFIAVIILVQRTCLVSKWFTLSLSNEQAFNE